MGVTVACTTQYLSPTTASSHPCHLSLDHKNWSPRLDRAVIGERKHVAETVPVHIRVNGSPCARLREVNAERAPLSLETGGFRSLWQDMAVVAQGRGGAEGQLRLTCTRSEASYELRMPRHAWRRTPRHTVRHPGLLYGQPKTRTATSGRTLSPACPDTGQLHENDGNTRGLCLAVQ